MWGGGMLRTRAKRGGTSVVKRKRRKTKKLAFFCIFFFFFLPFLIGFFFPLVCTISRVTVGGVWHFGNAISEDTKDFPEQLNNIEGDWIVPDFFHWLFFIGRIIFSAWLDCMRTQNVGNGGKFEKSCRCRKSINLNPTNCEMRTPGPLIS